jgi:hypothetical protein
MKLTNRRVFLVSLCLGWLAGSGPSTLGADEKENVSFVDLTEWVNRNRAEDQHGFKGNNLSEFKSGIKRLLNVDFQIVDKFLSLGSKVEKRFPLKIEGIKIDQAATRIRFLHGTGYGSYGEPGATTYVKDGTPIGEYVVHFADETKLSIPIVYGEDVRDWWNWDKPFEVTRGKVAWSGQNLFSREQGQNIYLYLGTWENPKPDVNITKIDYVSTATTAAAPFCLAITLEKK